MVLYFKKDLSANLKGKLHFFFNIIEAKTYSRVMASCRVDDGQVGMFAAILIFKISHCIFNLLLSYCCLTSEKQICPKMFFQEYEKCFSQKKL